MGFWSLVFFLSRPKLLHFFANIIRRKFLHWHINTLRAGGKFQRFRKSDWLASILPLTKLFIIGLHFAFQLTESRLRYFDLGGLFSLNQKSIDAMDRPFSGAIGVYLMSKLK